ncbi:type I-E CRISPR-associated protein Cas6/Cse3/CasE [Williamsia sp. CHRR-6]|uniref:type I-E CRISPR-associated protein Cas6/Cse3/CasE n=1 Tax=Williamsia sp. CHRR-6 TaxID=2835871 RepID=UPI001BD9C8F3|nr:type I-E CRISPR-associated protein Cas6/Cse3/CasE [Williamsia sp. CHRR-6]MBT0566991.1 type I-E CRISPR-associated protein Cas6/Cse3/CasE [Williamsia sp. CHRR-6]
MPFLTRMPINRRRRGGAKLLASPQAMHAAVAAAFPPGAPTPAGHGRVLWRVDSPTADTHHLYVVSSIEPDLSHIVEQAGWQTGEMWQTRDYAPVIDAIDAGQRYRFRLRANPVYSGRSTPNEQTSLRAHRSVKHQESWLESRAQRGGFLIPDGSRDDALLRVVDRGVMRFGRRGTAVTIAYATFDGVLEVVDPDALRHTLVAGLGRAKAYGCGLLTLAPLVSPAS